MNIEELNDILDSTAHELCHVQDWLPNDTPKDIGDAVGKILQDAAERIRKLAKSESDNVASP